MKHILKTTALYVTALVLGFLLFYAAHQYSTEVRGYVSYGGEVLLLPLPPFIFFFIRASNREFIMFGERGDRSGRSFGKDNARYDGSFEKARTKAKCKVVDKLCRTLGIGRNTKHGGTKAER